MIIDNTVILHNECNRLLRRHSRQNLINEVMYKLFSWWRLCRAYRNFYWYRSRSTLCFIYCG